MASKIKRRRKVSIWFYHSVVITTEEKVDLKLLLNAISVNLLGLHGTAVSPDTKWGDDLLTIRTDPKAFKIFCGKPR